MRSFSLEPKEMLSGLEIRFLLEKKLEEISIIQEFRKINEDKSETLFASTQMEVEAMSAPIVGIDHHLGREMEC